MRYSIVAPLALAASASAWNHGNVTYTTEVVTAYTTYCPGATQVVHNGQTYTVTEATTLTITNCPCTITKPVIPTTHAVVPAAPVVSSEVAAPVETSEVSVPAPPKAPAAPAESVKAVSPPASAAPAPPFPVPSSAAPAPPAVTATSSVSAAPSGQPTVKPFTGAGNKVAASGMGLAALAGIAAFFL